MAFCTIFICTALLDRQHQRLPQFLTGFDDVGGKARSALRRRTELQRACTGFLDADVNDGAAMVAADNLCSRSRDARQDRHASLRRGQKRLTLFAVRRNRVADPERQRCPDLIRGHSTQSVHVDDADLLWLTCNC